MSARRTDRNSAPKKSSAALGGKDARIRILVVDDHPIVRQGIRMLVNQEADMVVCGEAESAPDALQVLQQTEPDVAVVDLALKESSGLDLIKDIRIRRPNVLILVLSMRDESFYAERTLRAGARGFLTKEEGTEKVVEGIRQMLDGQYYLSERIEAKMISRIAGGTPQEAPSVDHLTDRELQIYEMIGQGMPTREIAKRLHLSVKTIDSHREHIKDKLQVESATELLKHAIQWVQGVGDEQQGG